MENTTDVRVIDVIGSTICVSSDDGGRLYDIVSEALKAGRGVRISFEGVDNLTSAFLNSAIGQLYGQFDEKFITSKVSVVGMIQADQDLLKQVAETAKLYFLDRKRFEDARREVLGYDSD